MSRIEVTAESTVWQAEAADPAGHGCEPRVTRLASGAIVLSHRVGTTREGGDGRPRLVRSDDDGATWRVLASPFTHALPAGWDLRGCALAELADGGLLAVVVAIDKTSGKPPYNPVTEGLVPVRNLVARSDDGGATWSEPWDLADGRYVQHASQGLLALPDGGVLCTFETFKTYDDPGVWRYTGGVLRSDDGGRTWGPPVISAASDPDGDPHDTMWWDPRIARLASGELVQCYYAFRHATRTEGPVHIAWSPDDGATWSAPASTGLPGQATYPLPLPDGRLLVFQQRRADTQAMVAVVSDDGGRTFDRESERIVYEHVAEIGAGRRRLAERLRLPDVDGPVHLRPPVRRRHRPERGAGLLVRGRPDSNEHPECPAAHRPGRRQPRQAMGRSAMKGFEVLIGTWHGEGELPMEPPLEMSVEATIRRLGEFIVFSSAGEPAELPDSISIIGGAPDGEPQPMHYFDSRGVKRLFMTTLDGSTWTIWRAPGEDWNGPDGPGFNQRFIGEISADGNTIAGRWERGLGDAGDAWEIDFPMTYVRT